VASWDWLKQEEARCTTAASLFVCALAYSNINCAPSVNHC